MKIAVVGSGALGLYYGAMLQRGGHRVQFLLRRDYEAVSERGLVVTSPAGDFGLPRVEGFRSPDTMDIADLVLVGLKTFANDRYRELIAPLVGPGTLILTLQNGLGNEEELAGIFGREKILGGVAYLCSNRGEPGVVHHLGQGRILMGSMEPGSSHHAAAVCEAFRAAGIECTLSADLRRARWEKLAWNIPFNGICTIVGKPVDAVLSNPAGRRLVRAVMAEVIEAANAQGLSVPIPAEFIDEMIGFSARLGAYRPSTLIDRAEGRELELKSIFAAPVAAGADRGIAMPLVNGIAALLELGEPERR